jgi:hypothetical protein
MNPTFTIVVWLDTISRLGWFKDSEKLLPAMVITVGFLVGEDEKMIHVAASFSGESAADVTTILKAIVIKRKDFHLGWLTKWLKGRANYE